MTDTSKLITIPAFAKEKDCSRQTIYTQIRKGKIKTVEKLGRVLILRCKQNNEWQPGAGSGRPKTKRRKK